MSVDSKLVQAEQTLQKIHSLAMSEKYLNVPYRQNQFEMAKDVIFNVDKLLMNIAELAQVGLGD